MSVSPFQFYLRSTLPCIYPTQIGRSSWPTREYFCTVNSATVSKYLLTWGIHDTHFYKNKRPLYFPDDLVLKGLFSFDIFNSHSFVQFIHRNIAYTICIIYLFIGFFIFIKKKKSLYKPYLILFFIVLLQIVLGILTLTSGLNFFIASSHQISSILLVYFSLNLYFYSIEWLTLFNFISNYRHKYLWHHLLKRKSSKTIGI